MKTHYPILRGETAYSYIVRWAYHSGYPDPRAATTAHIGSDNFQFKSHFPSFLPELSVLSNTPLSTLIEQHTILPFYKAFTKYDKYIKAYEDIFAGNSKDLHTQLSLVSSRNIQGNILAYCSSCVTEDISRFGVQYWHRDHQVPGQVICVKHKKPLNGVSVKRREFALPPTDWPEVLIEPSKDEKLISAILYYFLSAKAPFDADVLKGLYLQALLKKGFVTSGNNLRVKLLCSDLKTFWSSLCGKDPYTIIFNDESAYPFPAGFFYNFETQKHPVKHALLIGYLFGTIEAFMAAYQSYRAPKRQCDITFDSLSRVSKASQPKQRQTIVSSLKSGQSMRSIAKRLHTSISVVKGIACRHDLAISMRPQKITPLVRHNIMLSAELGQATSDIATANLCSIGAVEQIIGQQLGLVERRKKLRFNKLKNEHRQKVLTCLVQARTRNDVRKLVNSSYLYLFKNDKEWLYQTIPPAVARKDRRCAKQSN